MRSLVAEIFHSLSRNSVFGFLAELVVLRAHHHADRPLRSGGKLDPALGGAAGGARLQFVAGLQRTRIGAAEAGAGIDREAAEHRLARDPALDREIAERAAAGKAERQGFAVRQRHRTIPCNGATGDIGAARRSRERDAHRAFARGEGRAERTDLDRGGERRVSDQRIRRREREPVHRAARRQAVALRAVAAAVLHRTRRPDGGNDELAHDAINSATISPPAAARSCSAKVLASTGENVTRSPGSSRKIGSRCN